jgi:type IV secretory pathway VirB3-like protein
MESILFDLGSFSDKNFFGSFLTHLSTIFNLSTNLFWGGLNIGSYKSSLL